MTFVAWDHFILHFKNESIVVVLFFLFIFPAARLMLLPFPSLIISNVNTEHVNGDAKSNFAASGVALETEDLCYLGLALKPKCCFYINAGNAVKVVWSFLFNIFY